jgi:hypothetical protein
MKGFELIQEEFVLVFILMNSYYKYYHLEILMQIITVKNYDMSHFVMLGSVIFSNEF